MKPAKQGSGVEEAGRVDGSAGEERVAWTTGNVVTEGVNTGLATLFRGRQAPES
jgi:hypothetical protein